MFTVFSAWCIMVGAAVHPTRFGLWRDAIVLLVGLAAPTLWFVLLRVVAAMFPPPGIGFQSDPWMHAVSALLAQSTLAILGAIIVLILFRARVVALVIVFLGILGAWITIEYDWTLAGGELLLPKSTAWVAFAWIGWLFHPAILAASLYWAISARRAHKPAWACQSCGYDLRGSPTTPCPECGSRALESPVEMRVSHGFGSAWLCGSPATAARQVGTACCQFLRRHPLKAPFRPARSTPDRRKPLWRFGWPGWLALVCGLPVLLLAISGRNPVYEAQSFVMDRWGVPAMFDFTIYWFVYPWMQLTRVGAGPFALVWVLLALGIYPRRVSPLTYAYFVTLCLAAPLLHAQLSDRNLFGVTYLLQALRLPEWAAITALELLLFAGGLWWLTRSWKVLAVFTAASTVFWVPQDFLWAANLSKGLWLRPWATGAWHATCATTLLVWAIKERRHIPPWWICQSCGYDLRGCNAELCPECGTPHAPLRAPSASPG